MAHSRAFFDLRQNRVAAQLPSHSGPTVRRDSDDNGAGGKGGKGGGGKGGWRGCGWRKGNGSNNSRDNGGGGGGKGCRGGKGGNGMGDKYMVSTTAYPSKASDATGTLAASSRSRFSPLAAGFIGALLSFVVVSAIVWGTYFLVRRRRARRTKAMHPPPDIFHGHISRQLSRTPVPLGLTPPVSSTAVSPMPCVVADAAADMQNGARSLNPFVNQQDPRGVDPFAEPYQWKPSNSHPSHTLSA
ncbi:hypothetical protein AURDEDRAFT_113673 [Auricularia subglabra TFB-10046 SS5]|nr:hypothetical protein AURDEDRAFT_113673 [Auricularia subglabra TFB-10046 SS5]